MITMDTEELSELFRRALGWDCEVDSLSAVDGKYYKITISENEIEKVFEEFSQNCKELFSTHEIAAVIEHKESIVIHIENIESFNSETLENKLDTLDKVMKLHELVRENHHDSVEIFLEKEGWNVNDLKTIAIGGESLLISAARVLGYVTTETIELLVRMGANINHQDNHADTAWYIALRAFNEIDNQVGVEFNLVKPDKQKEILELLKGSPEASNDRGFFSPSKKHKSKSLDSSETQEKSQSVSALKN